MADASGGISKEERKPVLDSIRDARLTNDWDLVDQALNRLDAKQLAAVASFAVEHWQQEVRGDWDRLQIAVDTRCRALGIAEIPLQVPVSAQTGRSAQPAPAPRPAAVPASHPLPGPARGAEPRGGVAPAPRPTPDSRQALPPSTPPPRGKVWGTVRDEASRLANAVVGAVSGGRPTESQGHQAPPPAIKAEQQVPPPPTRSTEPSAPPSAAKPVEPPPRPPAPPPAREPVPLAAAASAPAVITPRKTDPGPAPGAAPKGGTYKGPSATHSREGR